MKDWVNAHRKALLAAVGAIVIIFADDATVTEVTTVVETVLLWLVPNDQDAIDRIYHRS